MASDSDPQEEVKTIGKLVLYKNVLVFEDTAYQVSNICSMWVADHSYSIKHKFPNWILVTGVLGVLLIFIGIQGKLYLGALLGLAMCAAAFYGFKQYKPETSISKFAIGIELNSGRRRLFTAPDQVFVQQAAHALAIAMADKAISSQKVVMNFDNKSINIENADHSTIIGGNLSDSLVENI